MTLGAGAWGGGRRPWWWWSGVSGVVTTLALVVRRAQSESMINTTANPTTRTDTNTQTNAGDDKQMAKGLSVRSSVKAGGWSLNHSEAEGLKVRNSISNGSKLRKMTRTVALGVSVLACAGMVLGSAGPASAATGGIPLAKPIVDAVQVDVTVAAGITKVGPGTLSLAH